MRSWWLFLLLLPVVFSITIKLPELDNTFVVLVGMLSVLVIVMYSIVASFTQNPRYMAYFKIELQEFITSIIIVAFVIGFFPTTNLVVDYLTDATTLSELGERALDHQLVILEDAYRKIAYTYQYVGAASMSSFAYTPSNFGYYYTSKSMAPFSGLRPVLQTLQSASSQVSIQYLAFKTLKILLRFFSDAFNSFLLPLGFAMRIFPFTRKAGSTLIALAFGLLIFFPASLVAVDYFAQSTQYELNSFYPEQFYVEGTVSSVNKWLCQNEFMRTLFSFGDILTSVTAASIYCISRPLDYWLCWIEILFLVLFKIWPMITFAFQWSYSVAMIAGFDDFGLPAVAVQMEPIWTVLVPAVSRMTMFSILSMLFIGTVTFVGTKSVSVALGGDFILYGLSRVM